MDVAITLPTFVTEASLVEFAERLGSANGAREVTLDFRYARFMISGALVALVTRVVAWRAAGVEVRFVGYRECEAFRYLQRMNLFRACGYDLPEDFRRHDPRTRFVPVRRIGGHDVGTDRLATEVASVIVPDQADTWDPDRSGAFDLVEYAISELACNTLDHARGAGFVSAQYHPRRDTVRVCLGDCGIGVRESFRGSPYWRDDLSDLDALRLALTPEVSSKAHLRTMWGGWENAGVGLSLLREVSVKTGGEFVLLSGEAYCRPRGEGRIREGSGFRGTLCAMTFHRDRVRNFAHLLYGAKVDLGLITPKRGDHAEMFG